MADIIGMAVAGVAGDMAGRALGKSKNNGITTASAGGPTAPAVVGATGANPLDTEAGVLRQQKRNVQAQDLSLFTLSNSKNLLNNNSLLGL